MYELLNLQMSLYEEATPGEMVGCSMGVYQELAWGLVEMSVYSTICKNIKWHEGNFNKHVSEAD